MRHAGSLLLSLFLAPLIWVATGYGLNEIGRTRAELVGGFEVEIVLGLAALVAGGALYALLVMARLSPIGPALIGLVFVGLSSWAAFDPTSYFDTMPTDLRDNDFALTYPALGYSALLAVPLLATLLSPRRWRRHAHAAAATSPQYAMPAAGMPPGAVPPGGAYAPPYGGPPTFGATPGYLAPPQPGAPSQWPGGPAQGAPSQWPDAPAPGAPQPARLGDPAPTAPFQAASPAPTSGPPVPSSAPPAPTSVPPAPVEAPTTRIPNQTPPPLAEQVTTTRFSQPPPPADAPTTRIPTSPAAAPPAAPPVEAPTTRIPTSSTSAAPAGDQTTTRFGAQDTEATQLLKGPPPKDAYPRPAWSAPTPPPITPPGARKHGDDDFEDPEATQPSR
jgi:hypothetical protein